MQQNGWIGYYLITEKTNDPFIFTSRFVTDMNNGILLMNRIQKYGIEECVSVDADIYEMCQSKSCGRTEHRYSTRSLVYFYNVVIFCTFFVLFFESIKRICLVLQFCTNSYTKLFHRTRMRYQKNPVLSLR
jgi:hypothetical protein